MKYFTLSNVADVFFLVEEKGLVNEITIFPELDIRHTRTTRTVAFFFYFAQATVLPRLSSTHADTKCPRADCVSLWTMVLIGMGVSYDVGTRVFVQ